MKAMTQTQTAAQPGSGPLVPAFFAWYFGQRPQEIASSYLRYARAFGDSFAMLFMLKTLLSPWKSITDAYPSNGFNVEGILSTFFLNLTSRAIGFVVRGAAIVTGLLIQCALLCGFTIYLALWLLYPILLAFTFPALVASLF